MAVAAGVLLDQHHADPAQGEEKATRGQERLLEFVPGRRCVEGFGLSLNNPKYLSVSITDVPTVL